MPNEQRYRHCRMKRPTSDGRVQTCSAWIPVESAVLKGYMRIRNRQTREWIGGWMITFVSKKELSESEVLEQMARELGPEDQSVMPTGTTDAEW